MRSLMLTASPLYAGVLTLLFLILSARVMQMRGRAKVMFGSAGDPDFERVIRAHGNFVEYAPLGILLLLILEVIGAPNILVNVFGVLLLIGRFAHAAGLAGSRHIIALRGAGMLFTLLALLGLAVSVLFYWYRLISISAV
ncbi:hypothetical protein FHS85_001319 [Rhodoligotrophos appendicifer]|uniref:MAPEG family protein n=1 Tax=Rhodoligotrophos appendicifer TaxID=987056 RepID=UPI0011868CFF|nr:MAPEG family protein [Rhodoligotrophos appendicifer]